MKNVKYIVFFSLFALYVFLDNLGFQNYRMLIGAFGWQAFALTFALNILISYVSAITIDKIIINKVGSSVGVGVGNIIGAVFAGCTSCGVSLLAVIGVNFALPAIAPGGIEYKLLALLIVTIGYYYTDYRLKKGCKIQWEILPLEL